MKVKSIHRRGQEFVMIPKGEFDRLMALTEATVLPSLPSADGNGCYPAVEFARVSLARKLIRDRQALGLTRAELARRAKVRVETLAKIESGQSAASVAVIDKIDNALSRLERVHRRRTSNHK